MENVIIVNDENKEIEREINRKEKEHNSKNIQIKFIERHSQTTISILIVDRKYILAAELKDDSKDTSIEAIGLATTLIANQQYYLMSQCLKRYGYKQNYQIY